MDHFIERVQRLIELHKQGLLGGDTMPEDALIPVVPGDKLADILTLGMALNYQRSAYALWDSVANTYRDEDTRWVFNPSVAVARDVEELRECLQKYRVALQPNRHPEIWRRVAHGIVTSSQEGDVPGLLKSVDFDVRQLKTVVQETRKTEFPYLSGPKIFNYWLYVLESYAHVLWKHRELITIAPDTHILQATVKLGLCSEGVLKGSEEDRKAVAQAWETALAGTNIAPIDVHTPLWLWSRAGFPVLN